jgi:hypothetical protein
LNKLLGTVSYLAHRYIYLILLVITVALLWRPLGPLGIIIAYVVGVVIIAGVRRIWRR